MPYYVRTIGGIVIVFLALFHHDLLELWKEKTSLLEPTALVISILSARENFEQREAARSTWLKDLPGSNNDVKSWFIVGNSSCDIPPEYRLSLYGCEKWNINSSGVQERFFAVSDLYSGVCSSSSKRIFYQGFSFQVNYAVVITKLGVHSHLLMNNVPTRVAVMDVHNKEIIVQATVSSNQSTFVDGYLYTNVDEILLPKNYEGLLLVEGYLKDEECSNLIWNDGGGVVSFKRIYSSPDHLESRAFSSHFSVATSIGFFIPDMANLKKIIKEEDLIKQQWNQKLEDINKRLITEATQKKDMIIVDAMDTYRNLPVKLLKFYKWLHSHYNYSYLLKTDDDCIVDVMHLLTKLNEDSRFGPTKLWIWSRFRKDWPVNYMGKWADFEYRSSSYPSFPCGAAYFMSRQTVSWLSSNAEYLHPYQGEDVSIGIWLSAINPDFIEDENFECDAECGRNSYNRAQLSPSQVHEVWSFVKECANLCFCKDSLASHDD